MMTRKVLYNKSRVRGRPVILHSKQSYSWMVRHIATDKILLVEASFNFGDVWTSFTAKKKLRKITNSRIEGGRHNSPRCSKFRFRRRQDIRHLKEKVRVEFNLRNGTVYRYWRDSASSGVWPKDGRNCARTHAKSGTPRESIVGKETYWSLVKSLDRSDRRGGLEGRLSRHPLLREAIAKSSDMGRDVYSLMSSIQRFFTTSSLSKVPRGTFLGGFRDAWHAITLLPSNDCCHRGSCGPTRNFFLPRT